MHINSDVVRKRSYGTGYVQSVLALSSLVALVLFALDVYWLTAVGVGAFVYYLSRFIFETGKDISVESLILVIASLQWIIGPFFTYYGWSDHYKYKMYVEESQYMLLAVPSVVLLSAGLYFFRSNKRMLFVHQAAIYTRNYVTRLRYIPFYLIGIGFVFSFLYPYVPSGLYFVLSVLSNLKYIGLIYIILSDQYRNKELVLFIAFIATLASSLNGAMFHDLLLWLAFIGMYYAIIKRPTSRQKIAAVMLSFVFIFLLQSGKTYYRENLSQGSGFVEFGESIENSFSSDEKDNVSDFVNRINQGWIISKIMEKVPEQVPHADGETVVTAVKSSLLPRILFPEKPVAGGKENYEKYTGYVLQSHTSMGISLLGEAYINYGIFGAWIFMLIFGLVISFTIKRLFLLSLRYPTLWLWLPLIFLHFVKAETELLVQLNYLIKSAILVIAFLFVNKHFLKIKL